MSWDRELGSNISTFLMIITLILLILKRKKLGKHIGIFTLAIGVGTLVELINTIIYRWYNPDYNSTAIYVIGVNFFVFFLFFIYFQYILVGEKHKKINLLLMCSFVVNYFLSAVLTPDYFTTYPFLSHLIQVSLLTASIFLVLSETFNSDKILVIKNYYPFWICIGLMSIYFGVMPLLIISKTASKMMSLNVFFAILFGVNFIGYSILITGIFFARNLNKKLKK